MYLQLIHGFKEKKSMYYSIRKQRDGVTDILLAQTSNTC